MNSRVVAAHLLFFFHSFFLLCINEKEKVWDVAICNVTKLNEWQVVKGACALFTERKECDGNHAPDETIIPPLSLLPHLTHRAR